MFGWATQSLVSRWEMALIVCLHIEKRSGLSGEPDFIHYSANQINLIIFQKALIGWKKAGPLQTISVFPKGTLTRYRIWSRPGFCNLSITSQALF